ncbi:MAG: ABC transporter ATP-binding protein [Acidobacteriota bacterium]
MDQDFLRFERVTKYFGNFKAVDDVTLSIRRGEVFSLLGPSGCGKTTLLRICAGFERPDAGRVLLNGVDITPLPPNRRKVNLVFQNYALFPHLTVRENIAFGLRAQGADRRRIQEEVDRMLELIQMEGQGDRFPSEISGGQKQRVALARALVLKPDVLLLDEPLAALDLKLRQRMLIELDRIHDEVGITFVYVTHDQSEAMSLSDRIGVMNHGRLEQVGTPAEIYEAPVNSFVAAFIGDTNFLEGTVEEIVGQYSRLRIAGFPPTWCFNDRPLRLGQPVYLSVRPEKIQISRQGPAASDPYYNVVEGEVEDLVYFGAFTKYWVRVEAHRIVVLRPHRRFLLDETPPTWGDRVVLSWHADDGYLLEQYHEEDERLLSLPEEAVEEAEDAAAPSPIAAREVEP